MNNLRIIADNYADSATLTAAPAVVATLPVTNLQLVPRAQVMRTTSTADQDIKGTWTAPQMLSGCALWRHNLTSSAKWRLKLYSDAAWTTLAWDSGDVDACPPKALNDLLWGLEPLGANVFTGWGKAFSSMWFAGIVTRSFKLTLKDATNPAGFFDASRLFLGTALEPIYNMSYGLRLAWQDDSKQGRTDGGSLRTDAVEPYRSLKMRLEWLTDSDRPKFFDMGRSRGKRKDVFVSCFSGAGGAQERDYAFAAKFTNAADIAHTRHGCYAQDIELEET